MTAPYLLTLSAEADRARTAPYLEALAEVYPACHLAFPIRDPLAAGITDKVENATAAILFITANALTDALLRASVNHLLHTDIPLLISYLDEITLPAGLQFQLSLCPVFYPNRHETLASAIETLKNAPYIKKAFSV